jgi:hypothetical protein
MTKNLSNWTYENVTTFLKKNGFDYFDDISGIGKGWMTFKETGEIDRVVQVPRKYSFYKENALQKMIRQSGIAEEEWLKWVRS